MHNIGDSMITCLKKSILLKNGSIEVRSFLGITVNHKVLNVMPILKKRLNYLIVNKETNNATKTTMKILDKLLKLKNLCARIASTMPSLFIDTNYKS